MTITSHALIAFNATGIYIVAFSIIMCAKINKFEIIGHGLWIIGLVLLVIDPHATKVGSDKPSIIGTLIAFAGAGFGSILLFMNNSKRALHPVITMTHFYFFSVVYQFIFYPWFIDSKGLFFSTNDIYGAFGWLSNYKDFLFVMCIISPFTGVLEKLSYLNANNYFSLQTISIILVFEPYLGQVFGILLNQDNIPGLMTVLGLLTTSVGFCFSSIGQVQNHNSEIKRILETSLINSADDILIDSDEGEGISYQELKNFNEI